jgi:biopolymer transport protein ExbD
MSLEGGPDGDLLVSLDQHPLAASELGSVLRTTFEARPDKTLFVRAEGVLRYGQVVGALDVARGAGVERFGILSPEPARPE